MKRKIIKQGHNTLTITLPSEWVKKFNLKSGDEVDLSEKDIGLFVSTKKHDDLSKVEINISELDLPGIWKFFMAVYREGHDEIKVLFNPNKKYQNPYKFYTRHAIDLNYNKADLTALEMLQVVTTRFIGLEIIEHHSDFCIIKDMAEPSKREFDSSFRRVFLLIQQMGEELVEAINKNVVTIVRHTHDIDINVDKFHDYCIRIMNKTGIKNSKHTSLLFSILFILELLGDEFKHIAHHLHNDFQNKNLNNLLELSKLVVNHLNEFYEFYYDYSNNKLVKLSDRDIEIHSYLPKFYKKKSGKTQLSDEELEIFNHLRIITKFINALVELRVEIEVS